MDIGFLRILFFFKRLVLDVGELLVGFDIVMIRVSFYFNMKLVIFFLLEEVVVFLSS